MEGISPYCVHRSPTLESNYRIFGQFDKISQPGPERRQNPETGFYIQQNLEFIPFLTNWSLPSRELRSRASSKQPTKGAAVSQEQKTPRTIAPLLSTTMLPASVSPPLASHGPISQAPKQFAQRGNITPIACDACRHRKSKCNGQKPICTGCQQKGTDCVYTVSEDDRSAKALRANLDKIKKELQDVKDLLPLIANPAKREVANFVATEILHNGFNQFEAALMKKMLSEPPSSPLPGDPVSDSKSAVPHAPFAFSAPTDAFGVSFNGAHSRSAAFAQFPTNSQFQFQRTTQYPSGSDAVQSWYLEQMCYGQQQGCQGAPGGLGFQQQRLEDIKLYRAPFVDEPRLKMRKSSLPTQDLSLLHVAPQPTPSVHIHAIEANLDLLWLNEQALPAGIFSTQLSNMISTLVLPTIALPEKLAATFVIHMMSRFMLQANMANKDALPEYMLPVQADRIKPYPMEINFIPWPRIRAHLILNPERLSEAMVTLRAFSINWPDPRPESMVTPAAHATDRFGLTPEFEAHIRQLDNWSVHNGVLQGFPEWRGMARFT